MKKIKDVGNVVKLHRVYEDEKNVYLLMDYQKGICLRDLLKIKKKLSEDESREIIGNILKTLYQLHEMSIVHRDIAPGNILFAEKFKEG